MRLEHDARILQNAKQPKIVFCLLNFVQKEFFKIDRTGKRGFFSKKNFAHEKLQEKEIKL